MLNFEFAVNGEVSTKIFGVAYKRIVALVLFWVYLVSFRKQSQVSSPTLSLCISASLLAAF